MSPWSPTPSPHSVPAAFLGRALRAVGSGIQVLGLLAIAYALLFHVSVVRGSSMTPGIEDGDRILVDHLSYVLGEVRRGDVAVLRCPVDENLDYLKRVIAVPGDRVRIDGGVVWVNGEAVSEPYVVAPDRRTSLEEIVAPDHFFVLGDNREHSADSREFGQVHRRLLRGRVDLRVWPLERAGAVR